jgi:hypothetical protein
VQQLRDQPACAIHLTQDPPHFVHGENDGQALRPLSADQVRTGFSRRLLLRRISSLRRPMFFHSAATCLHAPARLTREEARGAEAPGQRTARGQLL